MTIKANICEPWVNVYRVTCQMWPCVFVSLGCESRGDSLSPEWHTFYRRRAGPLPSVCTAGFLPALQPRAGHLRLVNTDTHTHSLM